MAARTDSGTSRKSALRWPPQCSCWYPHQLASEETILGVHKAHVKISQITLAYPVDLILIFPYVLKMIVRLISSDASLPTWVDFKECSESSPLWFCDGFDITRGRAEHVANCRNEAREGCAVCLKWRFIAAKLARPRAALHTDNRNATLLRTFSWPLLQTY